MHLGQWFHLHTVRNCVFSLLGAIYQCWFSCLHSTLQVYVLFPPLIHLFRAHARPAKCSLQWACSDGYVASMMSHEEMGSAALSYWCSHKRCFEPSGALDFFLHATLIFLGAETVSDSMTRSMTPVVASTSSPLALLDGRCRGLGVVLNQPFKMWILPCWWTPPVHFFKTQSSEARLCDVTKGVDAPQLCNGNARYSLQTHIPTVPLQFSSALCSSSK